MDRLQFIESIDQGNFISDPNAIHFFDHMMAAYNIVGAYPANSVGTALTGDPREISLSVDFINAECAHSVYAKVTNELHNRMDLYGKIFSIQPVLNNTTLGILIHQIN